MAVHDWGYQHNWHFVEYLCIRLQLQVKNRHEKEKYYAI